ncbi:hydrolase [Pilimelia anulata]|uniref:Hydrolase n=1 Tax=Pilimelia anulata TaxID=53371 RepID=A0A8J3B535_9ACTN|nr:haloacid dehalogenase-like hydrolase [Pilimelia anulata]GGJ96127.1 hydrolase [Pilimelia anulata]
MRAVVGFDLDLTLVDSRPGIAAVWRRFAAETGTPVDVDLVCARLGPPLAAEMANWVPADRVPAAVARYRELYPAYAIDPSPALPGAADALAAIRAAGGRAVVITAKLGRLAALHLDHLGLAVDAVAGDCFGPGKTAAMRAHGVTVFVGDHTADMASAVAAGVPGVGVTTGPHDAAALTAAGAVAVLDGLGGLPGWLRQS